MWNLHLHHFFFSLCEDNWNKVWRDSFGYVMLFTPVWASHDTDYIVGGAILFIRSRFLKQGATLLFWSCDASVGITWHWWHHQYQHYIC